MGNASPVALREKRPAASRPVGEGAGAQGASVRRRCRLFLAALFLVSFLERSEESRILSSPRALLVKRDVDGQRFARLRERISVRIGSQGDLKGNRLALELIIEGQFLRRLGRSVRDYVGLLRVAA